MAVQASPRRVVVIGGSSGIGQAVAIRACARGDRVINLDIRDGDATRSLGATGMDDVPCDLASVESIRDAFRATDPLLGGAPDVLVCSAAASIGDSFFDVSAQTVDTLLAINVRGLFFACQEAAHRMREAGGGRIIVITSVAAYQGWQREPVYCITKGAQAALVASLAVELAPFGIAINAVAPGPLEARSATMVSTRSDPEVRRHDLERIPMGRFGRPDEVARAVDFLAEAPWTTGQTIVVDGGFLATGLAYFGAARDQLLQRAR